MAARTSQGSAQYGGFNRYAQQQPTAQQDQTPAAAAQKPYDPFGQASSQPQAGGQYDGYPSQAPGQQAQTQQQQQQQQQQRQAQQAKMQQQQQAQARQQQAAKQQQQQQQREMEFSGANP